MLTFLYWVFVISVSVLATAVFFGFLYLFFPDWFDFNEKSDNTPHPIDYTTSTKKPFKLRSPKG